MAIRISAFHSSVAVEQLKGLFNSAPDEVIFETDITHCVVCRAIFALFYHVKDDPKNDSFLAQMNKLIAEDCKKGSHSQKLTVGD